MSGLVTGRSERKMKRVLNKRKNNLVGVDVWICCFGMLKSLLLGGIIHEVESGRRCFLIFQRKSYKLRRVFHVKIESYRESLKHL